MFLLLIWKRNGELGNFSRMYPFYLSLESTRSITCVVFHSTYLASELKCLCFFYH